jgi:hypothetical protein
MISVSCDLPYSLPTGKGQGEREAAVGGLVSSLPDFLITVYTH